MPRQPELPDEHATVEELLKARPGAASVLRRHGMACVGCAMAPFETLAEAAREYRVHLGSILEELRAAAAAAAAQPGRPLHPRAARRTHRGRHRTRPEQGGREGRP